MERIERETLRRFYALFGTHGFLNTLILNVLSLHFENVIIDRPDLSFNRPFFRVQYATHSGAGVGIGATDERTLFMCNAVAQRAFILTFFNSFDDAFYIPTDLEVRAFVIGSTKRPAFRAWR